MELQSSDQTKELIVARGVRAEAIDLQHYFDRVLECAERKLALGHCKSIGEVISRCCVLVAELPENQPIGTTDE